MIDPAAAVKRKKSFLIEWRLKLKWNARAVTQTYLQFTFDKLSKFNFPFHFALNICLLFSCQSKEKLFYFVLSGLTCTEYLSGMVQIKIETKNERTKKQKNEWTKERKQFKFWHAWVKQPRETLEECKEKKERISRVLWWGNTPPRPQR